MADAKEEARLAALRSYEILDSSPEAAFDEVTRLAATLCDTPIALVSFVDRDRQWFKSVLGLDVAETPRAISFCAHAIEREEPFIVSDAQGDERFADNPLVVGPTAIKFYAGIPLADETNAVLGTLCVLDTRPRELSDLQLRALKVLATQLLAHLRVRKLLAQEKALREKVERAHRHAALLADAGKILAASLDTDRTLEAVARLTVPKFAEVCSVVVAGENGSLRRAGEAGEDLAVLSELRSLRDPMHEDALVAMRHAIEARKPVCFADYQGWLEERLGAAHPYTELVKRLEVTAVICAPIVISGRVLGVLSVGALRSSGRRFDDEDLLTMGELAQRAGVAIDNARLYAEADGARARAEKANAAKDFFLAAVSHDLRTPLNAILGWAQLVRTNADDAAMRARAIEIIERSAHAQSKLIEDLLDSARIVAGQLRIDIEPVNLVSIVENALDTLRPTAAERGVELVKSLDPEAISGLGDAGRLQQVVWNLVSNAIKFSPRGGRVEVTLQRGPEAARLTVRDSGRGIPALLLPRIFDRFRQDDGGEGRRLGGLGLGLAIAKHIVLAVGGTISAHSEGEDRGASFVVTLPVTVAPSAAPPALSIASGPRSVGADALRGARVLVVDDDDGACEAISRLLTACGAEVTIAANAEQGFDLLARERPDVLVSDLKMQGASGYDLLRRVRDLSPKHGGSTPALAITGCSSELDKSRALEAGFQLFVRKPIEPNELLSVVASLRAGAPAG